VKAIHDQAQMLQAAARIVGLFVLIWIILMAFAAFGSGAGAKEYKDKGCTDPQYGGTASWYCGGDFSPKGCRSIRTHAYDTIMRRLKSNLTDDSPMTDLRDVWAWERCGGK
jgi:hypothetical protein